ncbi:glutamate synthase subunit beta [Sulfurimonas sp.]|uniref:glutamate synthase subunit beta n=1 Tax=Sulfurimonas sp. TaxID=2022749 RepID=UPI0025FB71F6|nr:glutamate synthase subunit beta [Sulfurimonas sp.]
MGKVTGFKEYKRQNFTLAPVEERVKHNNEFVTISSKEELETQVARCMDCGIPFCHSNYGCPVGNLIPQFNDLIYKGEWESAFRSLMGTNNFPEFTGRVCPATCETACVLGLNDDAVSIKGIEYSIIEKAYQEGWMKAQMPKACTGKKVAVVGSGPAGLSAANQLNKAGHMVSVYERDKRIGGLVRYGIPNFKLDKVKVVQRRVDIMTKEGIEFIPNSHIGVDIPLKSLQEKYDAVVLCGGASLPRDLPIENRDANNIHFAMEFLSQCNSRIEGEEIAKEKEILATGKHVVVIGGGDTGSDCVGNSVRQGAQTIIQIELMSKAPLERTDDMPWPLYPRVFKLSSSQEEGCTLDYDILSKSFIKDEAANVTGINCVKIEWEGRNFNEVAGSEFVLKADVIFLAMGFLGPEQTGMIEELNLDTDPRSNIDTNNYATSVDGVFSAGDMRRGQSLVVWAIHEGRECAIAVDEFLSKKPTLLNARSKSLYEKR